MNDNEYQERQEQLEQAGKRVAVEFPQNPNRHSPS
jgi:hypothetical protein